MIESEIMKQAIASYGENMQLLKAVEEMAELQKEIIKYLEGANNRNQIVEEMADVGIMLDQLKIIFSTENDLPRMRKSKLKRLENRMNKRD